MKLAMSGSATENVSDWLMTINELVIHLSRLTSANSQRRSDVRYGWNVPVTLGHLAGADKQFRPQVQAWAVDLSYRGTGLLTERIIESGTTCYMQFPSLAGRSICVPIRVIYSKVLVGSIVRLGVEFQFEE